MAPGILISNGEVEQGQDANLLIAQLTKAILDARMNAPVVQPVTVVEDDDDIEEDVESGAEGEEVEVTYEPQGTISKAVNLYEGQPDRRGKVSWTRAYPGDLEDPPENAESEQYALLIRNKKCYDGRKKLEMHSLVVQSNKLKNLLGQVFKWYPGLMTNLEKVKFSPPFEPFVHRWEQFAKAREEETDEVTKKHVELLWGILEAELHDEIREKNDHVANGVVSFDKIWTIFEPGVHIFGKDEAGNERVYRLKEGHYAQNECLGTYYHLNVEYVDFDGNRFGVGTKAIPVTAFAGTHDITGLQAFPLNFHPEAESVRERVTERGHIFEQLKGYHFKHYEGLALEFGRFGKIRHNINSRIIVDTHAFGSFNPGHKTNLAQLDSDGVLGVCSSNIRHEYGSTNNRSNQVIGEEEIEEKLTDDQLLLATNELRGYALKDKKWLIFFIPNVREIVFNDDAFKSLVAPPNQKELILAFTRSQRKNKAQFDDIIEGKGRGIIMLLSGPPGVGKTLTAESVAETMRVPLYTMSSGDLGTSPSQVETALGNILEMNTKWNAVLLLDECDVFLEERSAHDIERNKLVSIFLRMLEYYEGILFLTTNRVENMDAAFESRIHLSLQYNELDKASRQHVWQTFLTRSARAGAFSAEQIDELANEELNGRQIKNVLKTAQLLASDQGKGLGYEHVKTVMEIRKDNRRT